MPSPDRKICANLKKLNGLWINDVPIPFYFPFQLQFYLTIFLLCLFSFSRKIMSGAVASSVMYIWMPCMWRDIEVIALTWPFVGTSI